MINKINSNKMILRGLDRILRIRAILETDYSHQQTNNI